MAMDRANFSFAFDATWNCSVTIFKGTILTPHHEYSQQHQKLSIQRPRSILISSDGVSIDIISLFATKMSDGNSADILSKVIEYLSKKGYAKTEATLRAESANQDVEGKPVTSRTEERGGSNYRLGFGK